MIKKNKLIKKKHAKSNMKPIPHSLVHCVIKTLEKSFLNITRVLHITSKDTQNQTNTLKEPRVS